MIGYKKFLIVLGCVIFGMSSHTFLLAQNFSTIEKLASDEYVPGELIIKFKTPSTKSFATSTLSTMSTSTLSTFADQQGLRDIEPLGTSTLTVATIDDGSSVEEKIAELQNLSNIAYVEPNYIYHTQSFNDTYVDNLWGLSQISGYQAFDIFSGNANPSITGTIVAVIDAGVAYDHPDLINQMWDGSECKNENNVPIIGGCIHGYDMFDNDPNPYPVRSTHGTHVAGTIAAEANNSQGILGVNFRAKIMAIRVGDDALSLDSIIRGISFAKHNGAKIINASFGGSDYSTGMYEVIADFRSVGGLFIAAAGNGGGDGVGDNNETNHSYPSDYPLDNIISVAATTSLDVLTSFSNYGVTSVDVGAPGYSIYSSVVDLPQSNIYTNTFDTSLGDFTTGGIQSSRGIMSGMAMGGFENFTSTYVTGISDSYIEKEFSLVGYSGYDLAIQTYCDTPSGSDRDFLEVKFLSGSTRFILFQTNRYYNPYINPDLGIHLIDYFGASEGNFYKETFIFDMNVLRDKNFTLRAYRYSDGSGDQTDDAGCFINTILLSGSSVGSFSYGNLNGTSMATPHVAGLVSLARSYRPELSYSDIKEAILSGGDTLDALSGKTVSGKRINAYTTLYMLTSVPVGSLTFLSGNFTNVSDPLLRLTTNKTGTYLITGAGISTLLTGDISLSGKDLLVSLSGGDGVKTLGVTFYDTLNKPSLLYTASIILDTLAPLTPVVISPLSGVSLSGTFSLLRNPAIDTGGISGYTYRISTTGDMSECILSGTLATTGVNITLFTGDTTYYRSVQSLDYVGLSSTGSDRQRFVLLWDTIPDLFTLTGISNASLSTAYTSSLVVQGITTGSTISIVDGTYQINGMGEFVATTGIVHSGDTVIVKVMSSSAYSTSISTTLTIGGREGIFTVTTKGSSGSSGGGSSGGGSTSRDEVVACNLSHLVCSGNVYVRRSSVSRDDCTGGSYLGKSCNLPTSGTTLSGTLLSGNLTGNTGASILSETPLDSSFSPELNNAYRYAYTIGITTMPTIQRAHMTGTLIRAHMAKMMVNYAIKILHLQPDTSRTCTFSDIATVEPEIQAYITLACQLGLMGVNVTSFDPYGEVTRAHFGTTLSRAIYGNTYNSNDTQYYLAHLAALKRDGIISNTDPNLQELRGYVMLMMMRADPEI